MAVEILRIGRWLSALAMTLLLASNAQARAGPREQVDMPTPTSTATATVIPSATPTNSPTATPSPTPTLVPTATLDLVTEITTAHVIERVMIWQGEIERIIANEGFEDVTAPLVMAIIAEESGGDWTAVSYAGACNLMQVIPRPWLELSASAICNSGVGSIYQGSYILQWSIDLGQEEGLDIYHQIGFYNCSYEGVINDRCGSRGGKFYGHRVIDFWLPIFEDATSGN